MINTRLKLASHLSIQPHVAHKETLIQSFARFCVGRFEFVGEHGKGCTMNLLREGALGHFALMIAILDHDLVLKRLSRGLDLRRSLLHGRSGCCLQRVGSAFNSAGLGSTFFLAIHCGLMNNDIIDDKERRGFVTPGDRMTENVPRIDPLPSYKNPKYWLVAAAMLFFLIGFGGYWLVR
jgi:hypothetical protein